MACISLSVLDHYVNCDVCLNLMVNDHSPMILSCLHTLCKKCIERLTGNESESVKCAKCNQECAVADIKPDFKTRSLVDDYKKYLSDYKEKQKLLQECGLCEFGNELVMRCAECNRILCEGCRRGHVILKADHRMEKVEEIIERLENAANQAISGYDTLREESEKRREELESLNVTFESRMKDAVKRINKRRQYLIEQINKHHNDLVKEVKQNAERVIGALTKGSGVLQEVMDDTDAKLIELKQLLEDKHKYGVINNADQKRKCLQLGRFLDIASKILC